MTPALGEPTPYALARAEGLEGARASRRSLVGFVVARTRGHGALVARRRPGSTTNRGFRQALRGAAALSAGPTEHVVSWASPAGRPLYEALGLHVVDEFEVWTHGARPEELAAGGAS